ncbi:hypothetical protein [Streptomyces jumonjinensis]|uniref:hypothetical protein n=1 Tax=Streptomyces jumonjinensis TaxID=1945 RepID=UPI0037A58A8C
MHRLIHKIAVPAAERHVRRLSLETALSLMVAARERGSSYQGSPDWLRKEEVDRPLVYLVPHLATRLRSAEVRCAIVLLGNRGKVTWMGLDVTPWTLISLRRVAGREAVDLIGKLAASHPSAVEDDSVTS